MRYLSWIILLSMFFACSAKETKPSADALLTDEALNGLKAVEQAYETKDREAILKCMNPRLAEDVMRSLLFDEADISFTPWIVKVDDGSAVVSLDWSGRWSLNGESEVKRGMSEFYFTGDPVRLARIDGDDPFRFDVRVPEYSPEVPAVENEPAPVSKDSMRIQTEDAAHEISVPEDNGQLADDMDKAASENEIQKQIPIRHSNLKVEDAQTESADKDRDNYFVQVGAWHNPEYAKRSLKGVRESYPAAVLEDEGGFHKLRVHGLLKREALDVLLEIEKRLGLHSIIRKE